MRKSKTTKTLVLITNHLETIYEDKWDGDVVHYTGMGQVGDQKLNFYQNKTLDEIERNHFQIHYFEVFKKGEYTYAGRLVKAGKAYQQQQMDKNKQLRNVWVFPLKLMD